MELDLVLYGKVVAVLASLSAVSLLLNAFASKEGALGKTAGILSKVVDFVSSNLKHK